MNTVLQNPIVVPPHVDRILDEIGRELQITPSQYARAERAYQKVGSWLEAEGSSLARFRPSIYPQGSMALRTTVRPLGADEFDLDLVCELEGWTGSAMEIYSAVGDRLAENPDYRNILEPKKRCWRLNDAGEFHLDALPGRDDLSRQGNAIEVPDRQIEGWKPSNPKDFAAWFEHCARPYYVALQERMAPLPPSNSVDAGDPLRRAVQLMKRHRDVRFDGEADHAPRSIVLTTLAGKYYNGQESVGEALIWILGGISAEVQATKGVLIVQNPVNEDENFADAWKDDPQGYEEFVDYVDKFALDLQALLKDPFGGPFGDRAGRLFGTEETQLAINTYNESEGKAVNTALERIGTGAAASERPWYSD